jgi:hypothetical protein
MALVFAPNTASNWNLSYQDTRNATSGKVYGKKFTWSIDAWTIPILFESPILAVHCGSQSASTGWKRGGWLTREQRQASLTPDLQSLSDTGRRVRLHKGTLIDFTQAPQVSSYALTFEPSIWLQDVTLTIYSYTGPIDDTLFDELGALKIDLLRIEAKINALN